MPRFKKAVAAPGTYQTPEGLASVSPARIQHWHDTTQKLLARGYRPPVSWGHVSKAVPATEDDQQYWSARYLAGKVVGSQIAPDGTLIYELDCPGVESENGRIIGMAELPDGKRVKTAIEEVSIGARNWTDGAGQEWQDAPIHLALTPLPVWVPEGGQPPFEPVETRSAQNFGMGNLLYRFATNSTKEPDMTDEKETTSDTSESAQDSGSSLKKVLGLLANCGLTLPDDTTPENLIERLLVACTVKDGNGDVEEAEVKEETEPVMLSTLRDPVAKAMAARLADQDRKTRLARVDALVARGLPASEARSLREQITKVQFSLTAAGEILTPPVEDQLALLERVMPKDGFQALYLGQAIPGAVEATPPEETEQGQAKWRKIADEAAKRSGLPARISR